MQYPIDVEKYIAVSRLLYGAKPEDDGKTRQLLTAVNDCYTAGLLGAAGFPIDAADVFRATAEELGCPLGAVMEDSTANKLIPPMVKWFNQAYEQGREDAVKGECCGTFRQDF